MIHAIPIQHIPWRRLLPGTTPFVGLATPHLIQGVYGLAGLRIGDTNRDAWGHLEPGNLCVCLPSVVNNLGSSVSPRFHLPRVTILSVIRRSSLPGIVYRAEGTDQGPALLLILPRASYAPVTRDACHVRHVLGG